MDKNKILGVVMLVLGVATLLWQLNRLNETGSFLVFGCISSAIIVLGIGAFFTDLSDFQEDDGFGNKRNKSFGELGGAQKGVTVMAILAAVAQLGYFKFGIPF